MLMTISKTINSHIRYLNMTISIYYRLKSSAFMLMGTSKLLIGGCRGGLTKCSCFDIPMGISPFGKLSMVFE